VTKRRRTTEVFTLSFLDCICCGFGAVILFYTIVSAQSGVARMSKTDNLTAEVNRLDEQVLTGSRNLAALHDTLEKTRKEAASAAAQSNLISAELTDRKLRISTYDASSLARRAHIEKLKSDIQALQEGTKRLEAGSDERAPTGQDVSSFRKTGGDRRYITGLRMHGRRILILLDVSASMLHEDLVSILRLRNADDAQKRAAAKWRRAVDTVHWLLTQVPPGSAYQIYTFNTKAQPLLPDSGGKWISGADLPQLARGLQALQMIVPAEGTSLYNAFAATKTLSPLPDQIVLITDGLPTQGKSAGTRKYVDSAARMRFFDEAVGQLPDRVPIDSVLLPMQGDSEAAHRFWRLARLSDGTLLMPAKDWP
jgi:polyhydroxyalkanoate synthesis regulator phasin